ncbi:MAG: hypothetical protein ACI89A_000182 [Porticoccaceae bacterium]|jgi:hypothetical protein
MHLREDTGRRCYHIHQELAVLALTIDMQCRCSSLKAPIKAVKYNGTGGLHPNNYTGGLTFGTKTDWIEHNE